MVNGHTTISRDAMMMNDLKMKTKFRVLAAVEEMQAANKPITMRGLAKKVQLAGHSGVRLHLLALERDGLIDLKRGKIAA
jgi:predicted ArsR family transcriptional regulator